MPPTQPELWDEIPTVVRVNAETLKRLYCLAQQVRVLQRADPKLAEGHYLKTLAELGLPAPAENSFTFFEVEESTQDL